MQLAPGGYCYLFQMRLLPMTIAAGGWNMIAAAVPLPHSCLSEEAFSSWYSNQVMAKQFVKRASDPDFEKNSRKCCVPSQWLDRADNAVVAVVRLVVMVWVEQFGDSFEHIDHCLERESLSPS